MLQKHVCCLFGRESGFLAWDTDGVTTEAADDDKDVIEGLTFRVGTRG